MTQSKFVSSEPESGYSTEKMIALEAKIKAALERADELNGKNLEIKTSLALKNKFISPQQEKELIKLVEESESLYNRYNEDERTEDLLAGIESHCQKIEQKRNEIFPDAPNGGKLKLAKSEKKEDSEQEETNKEKTPGQADQKKELISKLDAAYAELYGFLNDKKDAPKELYDLIRQIEDSLRGLVKFRGEVASLAEGIKEKYKKDDRSEERKAIKKEQAVQTEEPWVNGEPIKKSGFTKQMVQERAAEIKQRRVEGQQAGFTWQEIDAFLRENSLEPGSSEADKFMAEWDEKMARQELVEEEKQKKAARIVDQVSPQVEEEKRAPLRIKQKKDKQEREETASTAETGEDKERRLARLGAEITLTKIRDYDELWAETKQKGDEVFKQKTRELWKEFAVHGKVLRDKESGKLKVMKFTDLDGNASLGLLELAGVSTKNVTYKEPGKYDEGRINIDTGERHGVVVEDGGKTVFIDHHSDKSGKDSSATKFTYELLVSLGLLEKQKHLDELVEFVTQADNKTYPNEEKYFKNYNSNLLGLKDHIKFKHLVEFFKEGHKPHEVLLEKELKKMELFQASKQRKAMVKKSLEEMEKTEASGLVVETSRYGKIVVDINKRIPFGFDAVKHAGYQTYLSWSPADNSFFISSVNPITDSFGQGKNIRGMMWVKPPIDEAPLDITLRDILMTMTDGKFEPTGELAEFLANEGKEEKTELAPEKMEIFKKFGQQFYDALEAGANWEGYDEKNKHTTLDIQAKVFLTKQLNKLNLVEGDKTADLVEILVKKINK